MRITADIRLVALDLDGTLLDDDKKIPSSTIAVIHEIQARGVQVTLASSRPFCAVVPYARQLRIGLPLIAHSGAYIADVKKNNILLRKTLAIHAFKEIVRRLQEQEYYTKVYCDDVLFVQEETSETLAYAQTFNVAYQAVGRYGLTKLPEPIRMAVFDEPERIRNIDQLIMPWREHFSIAADTACGLEIVDAAVNKGKAMELLGDRLGISMANTLAIGNEGNDLGMIQKSGIGIAMENACSELKQIATAITKSNNQRGVEAALRSYILQD